jgi:hypothetical protein
MAATGVSGPGTVVPVRVVATRSPDELGPYRRALAPRFELIALPLLGEEPPEPTEVVALFEAVSTPDLGALWLASARAVAPVVAALQTLGIAAPPAFTVGARTAAAARAAGLTAESVGDDGVAAATALAARGLAGLTILAPRAEGGRDDAPGDPGSGRRRGDPGGRLPPGAAARRPTPALAAGLAALPDRRRVPGLRAVPGGGASRADRLRQAPPLRGDRRPPPPPPWPPAAPRPRGGRPTRRPRHGGGPGGGVSTRVMNFPDYRGRRVRRTEGLRRMVRETRLSVDNLCYPLFCAPGQGVQKPIASMPGQHVWSVDKAVDAAAAAYDAGIPSVILFGIPEKKDAVGSEAWAPTAWCSARSRRSRSAAPSWWSSPTPASASTPITATAA